MTIETTYLVRGEDALKAEAFEGGPSVRVQIWTAESYGNPWSEWLLTSADWDRMRATREASGWSEVSGPPEVFVPTNWAPAAEALREVSERAIKLGCIR